MAGETPALRQKSLPLKSSVVRHREETAGTVRL
jgi:hypothetical protein